MKKSVLRGSTCSFNPSLIPLDLAGFKRRKGPFGKRGKLIIDMEISYQ
jgi:hypothetical protein